MERIQRGVEPQPLTPCQLESPNPSPPASTREQDGENTERSGAPTPHPLPAGEPQPLTPCQHKGTRWREYREEWSPNPSPPASWRAPTPHPLPAQGNKMERIQRGVEPQPLTPCQLESPNPSPPASWRAPTPHPCQHKGTRWIEYREEWSQQALIYH